VAEGTTADLLDAGHTVVDSATAANHQGLIQFLNVAPGTYRITASGKLVDAGTTVENVQVLAGQTAVVNLPTNPAQGLSNAWLVGGPWKALPGGESLDLDPAQPGFDDSAWQTVAQLPGNLAAPEGALTGFGEATSGWLRVKFVVPTAWERGRDLFLDNFNVTEADETFFNGTKIGETQGGNAIRSYRVPRALVRFGAENTLAIRYRSSEGGGGITNRELTVRLGLMSTLPGDLNGDGRLNVADATLALQIAVGNMSATPAQVNAGDLIGNDRVIAIPDVLAVLRLVVG
jgi:hypothetical protein